MAHEITIHEDHRFKEMPEDTIYYCRQQYRPPILLGTFIINEGAWNAGIHGCGDGKCVFSNHTFNRECPYSCVYYMGEKATPGTTIGPEYNFRKHPERIYYQLDKDGVNQIVLGKVIDSSHAYDAGLHGASYGYSIFENKKFPNSDCRTILPTKYKVYFLE